jgi:hypothetical protein
MRELSQMGQAAFQPGNTADIADSLVVESGLRVDIKRRRGRGAGINPGGRFEPLERVFRHSRPRCRSSVRRR